MQRYNNARKASILGIIGNFFLCIIKSLIGFMTNSQAMIADSFNSVSDVCSSIMTFIGNHISSKKPDEDHNLGHGKAEYIYSMLISIIMILLSLSVFKNSIESLFFKNSYHFSIWLIIVCLITIATKLFLYGYTKYLNKKDHNLLLEANNKDHRNDCIITSFNMISAIFSFYGIYVIDGIVGIIISLWIFYTGIKIYKESYDVLMDKTMSLDIKDDVLNIIKKYNEIKKINHFNSTPVGYLYQISFTIFVNGNLSTFESHDIANKLEKEICKEVPEIYLCIIHVNPLDVKEK